MICKWWQLFQTQKVPSPADNSLNTNGNSNAKYVIQSLANFRLELSVLCSFKGYDFTHTAGYHGSAWDSTD